MNKTRRKAISVTSHQIIFYCDQMLQQRQQEPCSFEMSWPMLNSINENDQGSLLLSILRAVAPESVSCDELSMLFRGLVCRVIDFNWKIIAPYLHLEYAASSVLQGLVQKRFGRSPICGLLSKEFILGEFMTNLGLFGRVATVIMSRILDLRIVVVSYNRQVKFFCDRQCGTLTVVVGRMSENCYSALTLSKALVIR